jgi:septal ring factor EnvC (AmiA/AmiB activator)
MRFVVLGSVVAAFSFAGCTKRPSEEELAKLEEARSAATAAEQKLSELRRERQDLEQQLASKEAELRLHEEERDDLKMKMENHQ